MEAEIRFVKKPTRSSRKHGAYIIYIPKSVRELIDPEKKYLVVMKPLEEADS